MRQPLSVVLCALAVCLLPQGTLVSTVQAHEARESAAEQITVRTCSDLETAERRLEREERDLGWEASLGSAALCLLYYPAEDAYLAVLLRLDSIEQFRAAKADAVRRLASRGFDPCRITQWAGAGRPAPRLEADDRVELPHECQPRVAAGDPGAAAWLPNVRETTARLVDLTAAQMGWRPSQSLTILVLTDSEVAASIYQRYAPTYSPAEYQAQLARTGQSTYIFHGIGGSLILLNLVEAPGRQPPGDRVQARIEQTLAHEYTHFAQHGISGLAPVPMWFLEGQAVYQEFRNGSRSYNDLPLAIRGQRDGTAASLRALTRPEEWFAREQVEGRAAVYSRGYAAVAFLIERYGFAATVQLLRDNWNGNYERFYESLARLTRMDLDALDRALGAWLLEPGRVLFQDALSNPNSGWPRAASDAFTGGYEGDEYFLIRRAGSGQSPSVTRALAVRDFLVEIDARLLPPAEGGYLYLLFRRQGNGDGYQFAIDPHRRAFRLLRRMGEDWTTLINWTSAPAIAVGTTGHRVGVRARGPEIVLLVDGQEVGRARDETWSEGGVGFGVGSRVDGPAEGRFRNLVVTSVE